MKKILFVFAGALIVIGGLLYLFHISQNSSRVPSETASSQQVNAASRQGSAESSSASQSSITTSLPTNSSDATTDSSSVSTGSDQQSSSSSISSGSTSPNISSSSAQAVNRPQGAWIKSFEKNLYKNDHVTPSRYVYIGNGIWGVWVKEINTNHFPYVMVDQNGTVNPSSKPQGSWVQTFEKNLYQNYHVTPSRYVYIGKGYWEVWVKETDTGQYPYVTVNQYTGNFHG